MISEIRNQKNNIFLPEIILVVLDEKREFNPFSFKSFVRTCTSYVIKSVGNVGHNSQYLCVYIIEQFQPLILICGRFSVCPFTPN